MGREEEEEEEAGKPHMQVANHADQGILSQEERTAWAAACWQFFFTGIRV